MSGFLINGKHTLSDYGMDLLDGFQISLPEVYESSEEVPGKNGVLDTTEALTGRVQYKQRALSSVFEILGASEAEVYNAIMTFANNVHGKRVQLSVDPDGDYYFDGRMYVEYAISNILGSVTLTGLLDPYRLRNTETVHVQDIVVSDIVTIHNEYMPTIPTFLTDADMTIIFEDTSYFIEADTEYRNLDILFSPGVNEITCTGTGTITITYQEGAF